MKKIFKNGNYIEINLGLGGSPKRFTLGSRFSESTESFTIVETERGDSFSIAFSDVTNWSDDKGSAYTIDSLRLFLISNTGLSAIIDISKNGIQNGFVDYNDASTTINPVVLLEDQWIEIPNDGLGVSTNEDYLPVGVTRLMNPLTGHIDATQLNKGDSILIRNDYSVTPSTNNALLRFRYSLGSGADAYTLEKTISRLDSGSGIPYRESLVTDLIYMGDDNTKDNPIKLEVNLSTSGTLINAGSAIQIIRYE